METIKELNLKKVYKTPVIQNIAIDNEISLILTSIPQPARPYDKDSEDFSVNNPFKQVNDFGSMS